MIETPEQVDAALDDYRVWLLEQVEERKAWLEADHGTMYAPAGSTFGPTVRTFRDLRGDVDSLNKQLREAWKDRQVADALAEQLIKYTSELLAERVNHL